MSDVLSPDQIAELVAAAKDGDVAVKQSVRAHRPRRVREIDFSRPTKLGPDEERRFERAHETFCRSASMRLSAELRSPIELEIINVAQLTWAAALGDVPQPSVFGVVLSAPLETSILICVEQSLVFRMIERLIGGGYTETPVSRSLTEIELALARGMFGSLLATLSVVWHELLGLSLSLVELESQIANVELAPPSEPTLVLTIETRDESTSSTISLLVPYRSIVSVSERLSGKFSEIGEALPPDEEMIQVVRTAIGSVDVELRVEVGAIELTIGEVLALGEGDVVRLDAAVSTGAYLCAGDERLHRARPGRSGSRRAVQIVEQLGGLA